MPDNSLTDTVREFISTREGRDIDINTLRKELRLDPDSKAWENIHSIINRLVEEKRLKYSGKRDGVYKVIEQVEQVRVFVPGRERFLPFDLKFPQDHNRNVELDFAENLIIREGDLITIGGVKNKGKTTLCLNFCAENIDKHPVLMGNEYTVLISDTTEGNLIPAKPKYKPSPRFFNRLDTMKEWVNWIDEQGFDKFTLLPIREDYAERIVKDRINIIDWINIDAGKLYDIGKVLEGIKAALGRGIAIVALQKGENFNNPRGGQFVRDFSDVEILLDGYGKNDDDILLTIKGVKEKREGYISVIGKTYTYSIIDNGTKIINFREVKHCPACKGSGFKGSKECELCLGRKFVDK